MLPIGTYIITVLAEGTGLTGGTLVNSTATWNLLAGTAGSTFVAATYVFNSSRDANLFAYHFVSITTLTLYSVSISPGCTNNVPCNPDTGILERMRPVAQYALLTYTGSDYNNGGNVAAALIPGADKNDNIFGTRGNALGLYQDWENLATVNIDRYDGRLAKGACVRWRP